VWANAGWLFRKPVSSTITRTPDPVYEPEVELDLS
jgi:hypothetical protein